MILQPLIENAFLHSRTETLHLELTIRREEDIVHVCLENNGAFLTEALVFDCSVAHSNGAANWRDACSALV
jgi:sensor histidine kinase YesM